MTTAINKLKQTMASESEEGMVDVKFCVGVTSAKATTEAAAAHVNEILLADKEGKTRDYSDY